MIITDNPQKYILENMGSNADITPKKFDSYFEKDYSLFKMFGVKSISDDGWSHYAIRPYMDYLGPKDKTPKYYVFNIKYEWAGAEDTKDLVETYSKVFMSDMLEAAELGIDSEKFTGSDWEKPKEVLYND